MNADAGARVLVVDDEPSVLETIAAILANEGYSVVASRGLEEALAQLRAGAFDLVLTDLRMEDANGLDLLAALRRNWSDTTAVMLTGYASLDSAIGALREGAYDYLIKPCDVEELKATVARGIERCRLTRTLRARLRELEEANVRIADLAQNLQQQVDQATAELNLKVEELSRAKHDLELAQQQREECISMVVHELNQPLTKIKGYTQLLTRGVRSPDFEMQALSVISSETRRLERLVQDLMDVSRLSTGTFSIHVSACDLVALVKEQIELARVTTDRHVFRMETDLKLMPAICDRDRIAQVISNLLTNAIKYAAKGEIVIRLSLVDGQARIAVADQGQGIARDALSAIFEPYVRLPGGGNSQGSGLGLSIAKGIVEAHNGRIWAESPAGGGAIFTVSLPCATKKPFARREGLLAE